MSKTENKNITVSKLFLTLIQKHSDGSRLEFAKLINVNEKWLLDKCSAKDGLPAEKLFEILKTLGYKSLSEIDFDFNSDIAPIRIYARKVQEPKVNVIKPIREKVVRLKKEKVIKSKIVKQKKPKPVKEPKPKKPKKEVIITPKKPKKRLMRRLKPDNLS